jgi:hypothetical protein
LRAHDTTDGQTIVADCLACCQPPLGVEKWWSARLLCDADIQEQDTDVHDFIKRKAPMFPGLEVEYVQGQRPVLELEMEDDDTRALRAEVNGWKSEHLFDFLTERLEPRNASAEDDADSLSVGGVAGAWSAEIQSCSG